MPILLDLDTLLELYPDPEGRAQFLRRALEILRADRIALQAALASHAHQRAGELAHRLQGTAAFLTGDPDRAAAVMGPIDNATPQHGGRAPADADFVHTQALDYLSALESAVAQAIPQSPQAD